jgi:hypothetical protein
MAQTMRLPLRPVSAPLAQRIIDETNRLLK